MNALEIRNLQKNYNNFSLQNLDLTLPSGCIMGLVGENGAGKSTTIQLILDMISADGGSVTILGRDNKEDLRLTKEDVGVVLDEVSIPGCLTPAEVSKVMKLTFRDWNNAVFSDYLRRFSLPEKKKFREFSRGMKMKLGIAIALSHEARLLILDEATSGLDPVARDEILDILNEFTRRESHAVLISSHIVSDLEKICDYIAFLHRGRLLLCEEKDRLKERYGVVRLSTEDFRRIPAASVVGHKESLYGVEAIVARQDIPRDMEVAPVDIEQLFVFMAKEDRQ